MNYADIKKVDVANGPGVRVSLFVSGCTHRCEECFNPETWDFSYGAPFGAAEVEKILTLLSPHLTVTDSFSRKRIPASSRRLL